jgi:hypothetical protein
MCDFKIKIIFLNGKINICQKKFLNIKKILNILLNVYVIVVKCYILNLKFVLYQNHIFNIFLYELKNENKI